MTARTLVAAAAVASLALAAAACSDDDPNAVTLVVYDSFPTADTSLNEALASFTADTGIDVEILVAGDTGTMVSKAVLTAGNPEGDVMWGVDNTFLSRTIEDDVFEPYTSPVTSRFPPNSPRSCRTAKRRRSTSVTCA